MPITRARRRQESQFRLKLNISRKAVVCNRSYDARPYPRAWALKTPLPFASPSPLSLSCHLSAVTLLDLSPSSCLCTKCLRIPLAFSKLRARYIARIWKYSHTILLLTCAAPGQTRPFKFIFSLFPFAPANVYPSLERVHRPVPAMGRLFFCLSLFFILSTPRLRRIRGGPFFSFPRCFMGPVNFWLARFIRRIDDRRLITRWDKVWLFQERICRIKPRIWNVDLIQVMFIGKEWLKKKYRNSMYSVYV